MLFTRIPPPTSLNEIIECYWIAEDRAIEPRIQKIIPDGFTEIIFHYGDPYRICINDSWQLQSRALVGGQIKKHFFLQNTGSSGIIGIKLKPTALANRFHVSMQPLTDTVVELHAVLGKEMEEVGGALQSVAVGHEEKIDHLNRYFNQLLQRKSHSATPADRATAMIFARHGMVTVAQLSEEAGVGERHLENLFRKAVGLSPKLFSRIIRFNYIFELIQENRKTWSDLAYEAAFYDQSHFIRNFKAFTGENPGDYSFNENNMANFFLNK